ncbi:MAG: glycerol-3-phosphate dehydrogenase [Alphaproteobacteria bacterium]|nr:glycerol-3-phosphate dehydrogenase [Alphaproteobacteria bacterium]
MREGSLEAPTRHAIAWRDEKFFDKDDLDKELRRVFDICHGCRRCFNLCDSFPRLFDLIDDSETGELDSVDSAQFEPVVDACTLCDMCFLTKCPYVPPHEFDLDFPHLMLRYRANEARDGKIGFMEKQISETDRNGRLGGAVAPLANWATGCSNKITRSVMEGVAGIHREAVLPKFHGKTLVAQAKREARAVNRDAPAAARKAVIYATCFVNYNNPDIGVAALDVLAANGIEAEVVYPGCCGMPQLEQGDLARVAKKAETTAAVFADWIEAGYDVISLVPSCTLMMKFEWPLLLPENEAVKRLANATFDVSEYISDIARNEGLAEGLSPASGDIAVHVACHARAQNMGRKSAEMLGHLPDTKVTVIERCSGHGGSWGIKKENFDTAIKVGKPVARQAAKAKPEYVVSECPLARDHILQGMEKLGENVSNVRAADHPIQIMARAYKEGSQE